MVKIGSALKGGAIHCLLTLLLFACLTSGAQSATIVTDTISAWDGVSSVWPWGRNDATETYGQTFTAPPGAALTGFSVPIQDLSDFLGLGVGGPITYQV